MKKHRVRMFCATALSALVGGAITAFVFIVVIDVGWASITSIKLFSGLLLWATVAPLPLTLPLALLGGAIAVWISRSR